MKRKFYLGNTVLKQSKLQISLLKKLKCLKQSKLQILFRKYGTCVIKFHEKNKIY
jgi:hypothetical protein